MQKYIVLDIESPNCFSYSVSSIGIIVVENNEITDKIYTLINPEDEFEDDIIEMTGITPEMVKDKPKFYEFWPKIEEILKNNIIIGHNITYDLGVISSSLDRYNLEVPNFNYICTLYWSRKLLNLPSYSLSDIMLNLKIDYEAHNALHDAEVTEFLFRHLNNIQPITVLDQRTFNNKSTIEDLDDELYPNINELYGNIMELKYKKEITENNRKILRDWLEKNEKYDSYFLYNNIIIKLKNILKKKTLNKKDKNKISTITTGIFHSKKYTQEELNYQVLQGIMKMLKSDDKINKKEKKFIEKWLTYYTLPENINKNEIIESINLD